MPDRQGPAGKGRSARVYPRVCRGTAQTIRAMARAAALSPRVQGNRPLLQRHAPWARSIPACAGEPPAIATTRALGKVYPRVCRGTAVVWVAAGAPVPLSPRVQGNRPLLQRHAPWARSIPACAGEPRAESETTHPESWLGEMDNDTFLAYGIRKVDSCRNLQRGLGGWPGLCFLIHVPISQTSRRSLSRKVA